MRRLRVPKCRPSEMHFVMRRFFQARDVTSPCFYAFASIFDPASDRANPSIRYPSQLCNLSFIAIESFHLYLRVGVRATGISVKRM